MTETTPGDEQHLDAHALNAYALNAYDEQAPAEQAEGERHADKSGDSAEEDADYHGEHERKDD